MLYKATLTQSVARKIDLINTPIEDKLKKGSTKIEDTINACHIGDDVKAILLEIFRQLHKNGIEKG